ncbi:hypothetical protein [Mycobacterium sp. PSTR-4-N]|uniref:hypothetical protein n=1 Tax=Mycobacterium sp. PSTR-4-N TaxID=2917745 RepID=UPI001F14C749|nr:hypothetical protein [Mycobacterium sp. PSTR-4-N]MCG7592731.1 hypothetical protein [Mycobacterium sp. PSTR-4-N]
MALVGADTDQLRQLSRTFAHAADRLDGMCGEVTGRLASASWVGPDADRYRSQWHGESLALMRAVVAALRDAASAIDRNAAEQDQASSGAAGLPTGSLFSGTGFAHGSPWSDGGTFANPLVDMRNFLNSTATWPITWGTALDQLTPLGPMLPLIDALGLAGDSSISPEEKIIQAGNSMTDLGGGLIKKLGPAGYLPGVAVQQWGDVAAQVARADFSASALQTTGDYIAKDPGGAFDAARDAVVGYIPKLFSNLLP